MTAPDEIFAFHTPDDFDDDATITAYETSQYGSTSYTRTDLAIAQIAAAYEDAATPEFAGQLFIFVPNIRDRTPADAKAALDRIVAQAVRAEREACAKVADDYHQRAIEWAKKIRGLEQHISETDSSRVATAIRARGEGE